MQIGPSLSLLQALGSQPGAPERVRLRPAADVDAAAQQQAQQQARQPVEGRRVEPPVASAPAATPEPARVHGPAGGRVDIRV